MPIPTNARRPFLFSHLPLALATLGLLFAGSFLLHRSDAQARDTIRKHHLFDIEQALYYAFREHGTYPPYDEPTWCGVLGDTGSRDVRSQIETALRQVGEKYAKPDKPFPADPVVENQATPLITARPAATEDTAPGYFYWKRSPAVFELYSILEAAPTQDRNSYGCPEASAEVYDYGINSRLRYE